MTRREAEKLAAKIRKTAIHNVRVKVGQTNGQFVFHVHNTEAKVSQTIRSDAEWLGHDWHKINRPPKRQETDTSE